MSKNDSRLAAFYNIRFFRSAQKELDRLPKHIARNISRRIHTLAYNPRPAQSKKLVDSPDQFRLRVGDYRILFRIDTRTRQIIIYRISHRKDAYR